MHKLLNYSFCYPPILIAAINANKAPEVLDSYNITAVEYRTLNRIS
jgi:hypothetical protein